jgi:hypothetical protein
MEYAFLKAATDILGEVSATLNQIVGVSRRSGYAKLEDVEEEESNGADREEEHCG